MFFSSERNSFLPKELRERYGDNWPSDAIEVTPEEWETYGLGQPPAGMQRGADANGRPTWVPLPEKPIDQLATAKRREIEAVREDAFAAGMPTTVNGEAETVQTRPQDQVNLLGLRMKAESAKAAGDTTASQKFRGQSNATHLITPDEMIDLTNAALDYIEGIYDQSWQLKDQVDAAEKNGDREALEAIAWPAS